MTSSLKNPQRTRSSRRSLTITFNFRKEYKVWGDAQAMKGTYLK